MPRIRITFPKLPRLFLFGGLGAAAAAVCYLIFGSLKCAVLLAGLAAVCPFVAVDFRACKHRWPAVLLVGLVSAVVCYACTQLFISIYVFPKLTTILMSIVLCFGLYGLFYCLTGSIRAASLIPLVMAAFLSLVNIYVVAFRGTRFQVADVLAIRTAVEVVGNYRFFINLEIASGLFFCALWLAWFFTGVQLPERGPVSLKVRGLWLLIAALCFGGAVPYARGLEVKEYANEGPLLNGLLLNLVCDAQNGVSYAVPGSYGEEAVARLEQNYTAPADTGRRPNIIVVMNEAFSDLRIYNEDFAASSEVMPFADSLREDTVRGYALASVLGGGTANSEYEFLTGNTMAFLPSGVSSFQNYVAEDTPSLVDYLNGLGYESIGIHPEVPGNWMRKTAWERLGFQDTMFLEDFPRQQLLRGHVSDAEFVDVVLELLQQDREAPLFLYGVTMQNHSDYNHPDFEATVHLEGYGGSYPRAEQYLSLVQLSDRSLETLVTELDKLEEETILLFYGDHQPRIEDAFLQELYGGSFSDLDDLQLRYTIPFYIWANFDIPEQTVPLTSLNYLGAYLLEAAGIALPPYHQFLQELEQTVPAINALGFYSQEEGRFISISEARKLERSPLEAYEILQYDSIFGKDQRSVLFFPHQD